MIVISTIDGKKYLLNTSKHYDNAKEFVRFLHDASMRYVKSVDGIYILTKYIVTIKDS